MANVLTNISSGITALDLSGNHLGTRTTAELTKSFKAIPFHVTSLDLSNNGFDKKTSVELVEILKSIPATVTDINLGKNNLLHGKSISQRDALLKSFESVEENGRINISHNGEGVLARVLLPLLSAIKQQKITWDIASQIMSHLLPKTIGTHAYMRSSIINPILSDDSQLLKSVFKREGGLLTFFTPQMDNPIGALLLEAETNPEGAAKRTLEYFHLS